MKFVPRGFAVLRDTVLGVNIRNAGSSCVCINGPYIPAKSDTRYIPLVYAMIPDTAANMIGIYSIRALV